MAARVPKVMLLEELGDIYRLKVEYDPEGVTGADCHIVLDGPGAFATAYKLKDYFEQCPEVTAALLIADSLERLRLQTEEILEMTKTISSKQHKY